MKVALKVLALVLLFASVCWAVEPEIYDAKTSVKLAWDHDGTNADHFELQLVREGTGEVFAISAAKDKRDVTVLRPKSGVFVAKIRTCGDTTCSKASVWCDSVTTSCAQRKDGSKGPWKIRFKPSAPMFLIGTPNP